nr:hypothetical protein HmN_000658000 [Hymenolepis microstoma]
MPVEQERNIRKNCFTRLDDSMLQQFLLTGEIVCLPNSDSPWRPNKCHLCFHVKKLFAIPHSAGERHDQPGNSNTWPAGFENRHHHLSFSIPVSGIECLLWVLLWTPCTH